MDLMYYLLNKFALLEPKGKKNYKYGLLSHDQRHSKVHFPKSDLWCWEGQG